MIQSAMLFALGFLVSGLVWLAFSVAMVRRAKRLTERRILAQIATRRAEFETERDELRARHAVEMHRVEREVNRVHDMATAHRLEADVKERDLTSARAELSASAENLHEAQERLAGLHDAVQELERRNAETGTELRTTQHALKLETKRRAIAEQSLDEASIVADQRRLELATLRAQNDELRAAAGKALPFEQADGVVPRIIVPAPANAPAAPAAAQTGGTVLQLSPRPRQSPGVAPEQSESLVAEAARDLQRLAGEGQGDLGKTLWRAPARSEANAAMPTAAAEATVVAELGARRSPPPPPEPGTKPETDDTAETRFFEALAEIRALKRAASQAGE